MSDRVGCRILVTALIVAVIMASLVALGDLSLGLALTAFVSFVASVALLPRQEVDPVLEDELGHSVLNVGDIELDRDSHRVTRNSRQVHLGPTEFRLLEFLMQSPGRVFNRAQLLDGVWGRSVYVDERTVDVHIGRLRKAMMRGNERDPVCTVRGAGYAFSDELEKIA